MGTERPDIIEEMPIEAVAVAIMNGPYRRRHRRGRHLGVRNRRCGKTHVGGPATGRMRIEVMVVRGLVADG